MKKLRLLVTDICFNDCDGCCNKDWDLDSLEIEDDFSQYDEILITGGEPMLFPIYVELLATKLKKESNAKIYIYSSMFSPMDVLNVLSIVDGMTITMHTQDDANLFKANWKLFTEMNHNRRKSKLSHIKLSEKSIRVNVFKGVKLPNISSHIKFKRDVVWIKDCPLPKDEVFKKIIMEDVI